MMFEAVENFLNTEEFLEMLTYPYKTRVSNFNDSFYPFINKIIDYTKSFCDISEATTIEMWKRDFLEGYLYDYDWHIDYDHYSYDLGNLVLPIVSIIYYPIITSMTGGELVLCTEEKEVTYSPKQNSLVIFGPGIWHKTKGGYSTRRLSYMLNIYKEDFIKNHNYKTLSDDVFNKHKNKILEGTFVPNTDRSMKNGCSLVSLRR